MPTPDSTAMPNSDLDPFLFSGIGTQTNGAELTILSLLARLGSDAWTEAVRLALLPRAVATDWLAERIGTMPLSAQALGAARDTAATRLLLLPVRTMIGRSTAEGGGQGARTARWMFGLMAVAGLLALLGVTLNAPTAGSPDQTIQGGH